MSKYISILIAVFAMLFAVNAAAFTPPPAPDKGWYVVDQTGRMTSDQIQKLNHKIERISKATKNEFGILLLQDMSGSNIEDVANTTYKAWGVGKRGLDNGVLIVVALKERKSRIETGKGVEGEIPDLRANDILKNNLNPHLKTGDFYGGFDATLDAISGYMESRRNQKAEAPVPVPAPVSVPAVPTTTAPTADDGSVLASGLVWFFVLGTLGVIGIFLFASYLRHKREEEEAARQAAEAARRRREERAARIERDRRLDALRKIELDRQEALRKVELKTPVVPVPFVDRQVSIPPPPLPVTRPAIPKAKARPPITTSHTKTPIKSSHATPSDLSSSAAAVALAEERARQAREREEREARRRREREEEERAEARRQREEEEREARRRREREEEDRRSSYSSSSISFDWGGSSGGGGDSGGGFGGGDSGGGGSSSDW